MEEDGHLTSLEYKKEKTSLKKYLLKVNRKKHEKISR
jgi:hypothetical protein